MIMLVRYIINRKINWLFLYEKYLTRAVYSFFQHLTMYPREIFFHIKGNQLIIPYKSILSRSCLIQNPLTSLPAPLASGIAIITTLSRSLAHVLRARDTPRLCP